MVLQTYLKLTLAKVYSVWVMYVLYSYITLFVCLFVCLFVLLFACLSFCFVCLGKEM